MDRRDTATSAAEMELWLATAPPEGLPTYRFLTGQDDAEFCRRVSAALALGYKLYGPPTLTFDGSRVIAGQAFVWPQDPG